MPTFNPELSTSENLSAFGFDFVLLGNGKADIVDSVGVVVFTGNVFDTNAWLRGLAESGLQPH